MKLNPHWRKNARVRSYEALADGRASLAVVCNLLQESAAEHAQHLGIGYEPMARQNLAWAVARIGIEVRRKPRVLENLAVDTWIHGTRGPLAMREFEVRDVSGPA